MKSLQRQTRVPPSSSLYQTTHIDITFDSLTEKNRMIKGRRGMAKQQVSTAKSTLPVEAKLEMSKDGAMQPSPANLMRKNLAVFPLEDLDSQGYGSSNQRPSLKLDHLMRIKKQANDEHRRKYLHSITNPKDIDIRGD